MPNVTVVVVDAVRKVGDFSMHTDILRCGSLIAEVGASASPSFAVYFGINAMIELGGRVESGPDLAIKGEGQALELVALLRYAANVLETKASVAGVERVVLEGGTNIGEGA